MNALTDKDFEQAMYVLEQTLYRKLNYGVYRFRDIDYILGEMRRLWDAQHTDAGREAVFAKIRDPEAFIKYWKNVEESKRASRRQTKLVKENNMKKQYTKKQIVEAIAYWKKQLRAGNYKKLDEDILSSDDLQDREKACRIGADCVMHICEDAMKQCKPSNAAGRYVFESSLVKLSVGPVRSENYLSDLRQFYLGLATREYGSLKSFVEIFDKSNCPKLHGDGKNEYAVVKAGDYSGTCESDGAVYEFDVQVKRDCKWA